MYVAIIMKENNRNIITNVFTTFRQDAIKFIERNQDVPFFLYWAADGTHTPLGAAKEFLGTSQRGLYGDVVRDLDYGVGQIIAKLKELKLHRNTFVFFSSDNGPAGYQGLECKFELPTHHCKARVDTKWNFRVIPTCCTNSMKFENYII